MPNYKAVIFTNSIHEQYMTEQQQAINNAISSLATELVDYTDPRFALYSSKERVPCVMIFKDDARMQSKYSKLPHNDMINWIKGIVE